MNGIDPRDRAALNSARVAAPAPEPDPELIYSMALRYRHDFGLLDPREQDSICTTMRQLWEEVVGKGFYRAPPADARDAALEEAAKVCDVIALKEWDDRFTATRAANDCAAAIRALKGKA